MINNFIYIIGGSSYGSAVCLHIVHSSPLSLSVPSCSSKFSHNIQITFVLVSLYSCSFCLVFLLIILLSALFYLVTLFSILPQTKYFFAVFLLFRLFFQLLHLFVSWFCSIFHSYLPLLPVEYFVHLLSLPWWILLLLFSYFLYQYSITFSHFS